MPTYCFTNKSNGAVVGSVLILLFGFQFELGFEPRFVSFYCGGVLGDHLRQNRGQPFGQVHKLVELLLGHGKAFAALLAHRPIVLSQNFYPDGCQTYRLDTVACGDAFFIYIPFAVSRLDFFLSLCYFCSNS